MIGAFPTESNQVSRPLNTLSLPILNHFTIGLDFTRLFISENVGKKYMREALIGLYSHGGYFLSNLDKKEFKFLCFYSTSKDSTNYLYLIYS